MKKFHWFLILFIASACAGLPDFMQTQQPDEKEEDRPDISYDEAEVDTLEDVALKQKKNYYYGEQTRKSYTTPQQGVYELFNVLREPVKVDNYVRNVYYHDIKAGRIVSVVGKGQVLENVLHGPYTREINEIIVEKGMFFHGVKHETWLYQNRDSSLYDKEHFNKGWYKDSQISYYDGAGKTKIKEVIPIRYGKKEGNYYRFFENGRIAVEGQYVFDQKVGIWTEYWNTRTITVKRELQFRPEFYMNEYQPFIRREWAESAEQIYTSPKLGQ